ncbi:MAG TPA: patatin-like phospholipase family protein [Defluviitoga sp.]|nr:patatin-like phospholipase family protein [Defluviitoga sp.]HOP24198.1 patatin-like phospholipase family protein [Defluviitoga sp.]HPZ28210.1 patatin-like phospholipase family protein [Defluviitoga sp.]HQD62100.1 patatin-like phospholipase family protein [Defluviitoga sp.]
MREKGIKIYGLALGSGGARGAAHVALIEILKQRNIKVEVVTGSSAGAIVGAFYALYPKVNLAKVFDKTINKHIDKINSNFKMLNKKIANFPKMIAGKSFLLNDFVYEIYKELYGRKKFSDCKIELGIVSYDLESGEEIEITEGYIIDAVMASSNVPGVFPPLRLGGMQHLDGGVLNPVPVNFAKKLGADYVIASDLSYQSENSVEFNNGLEFLISIDENKNELMINYELKNADEVYKYPLTYSWMDFSSFNEMYEQSKRFIIEQFEREGIKL